MTGIDAARPSNLVHAADRRRKWLLAIKRWMWPGTNWVSRDKARLVKMLPSAAPGETLRTLDCGCGNAYFTYEASRRGSTCVGITIHDWERRSCEEMRDYLGVPESRMRFLTSRLDTFANDATNRDRFDQVLLLDVLEHVRDDEACLRQLHGLLNENGLLYLTTPDRDWTANADRPRITRVEDGWHVRNGYTMERLEQLLEESGFEPIDRFRYGTLGSRAVIWIQHKVFGRLIDPLTVATYPALKLLALALSPWRDPHTIFILARKRA